MFKAIPVLLLLIPWQINLTTVEAQNLDDRAAGKRGYSQVPSLGYCGLLDGSTRYRGQLVRLRASWQFGFETSLLYGSGCPKQPQAWLEFADEADLCPETKQNRNVPAQSDKEADVTVLGKLYGPGRYGHLGDYQFKFVVKCLEKIRITASDTK